MSEILIFGGTTEGRLLAEFCAANSVPAVISVTTEYGSELLPQNAETIEGKLDSQQIESLIRERNFCAVIDATHPYARLATENIRAACERLGVRRYRVVREESIEIKGRAVSSVTDAVDYLNQSECRALITTGSKELPAFVNVRNFHERLFVRVLPADGIEERCASLGFGRNNLIIEKGPFSVEQNLEHLRRTDAAVLITKESGTVGGYPEKARAAEIFGAELLTILRSHENGVSVEEMIEILGKERLWEK